MDFETGARVKPELNITPLIDIVFLLLVFFMLTSSMIKPNGIELNLPNSNSANLLQDKTITISLSEKGEYFWDEAKIQEADLATKLNTTFTNNPDQSVVLRVAEQASAQQMVTAMDIIRNNGGKNFSLATKQGL